MRARDSKSELSSTIGRVMVTSGSGQVAWPGDDSAIPVVRETASGLGMGAADLIAVVDAETLVPGG